MKLDRSFYERDSLTVARELLGKNIVHNTPEGVVAGMIVEVEAYKGEIDAAAHSYKGRRTARTEVMFGLGGYAYVYLIYGMYYCLNVVANLREIPEAVLIRALEPKEGIVIMSDRRGTSDLKKLCSGPGKLCNAMGITKDHNGMDLCGDRLFISQGIELPQSSIEATPRINIDYAGEAKDYLWRYVIKGSRFLSK